MAKITVQMPSNAKLYVNNVYCPLNNGKQSFTTGNLKTGQKYSYNLKLETTSNGQAIIKTHQVVFQAGQSVQVNFNASAGVFTVKN